MDPVSWRALYEALSARYSADGWWPADSPFEVMVGAVLTQNTTWSSVERALDRLRQAGVLSVAGIAGSSPQVLRELVRPAGSYTRKATTLVALADWVVRYAPQVARDQRPTAQRSLALEGEPTASAGSVRGEGHLALEGDGAASARPEATEGELATEGEAAASADAEVTAADMPTSVLRASLLALRGVGPETADDILLYVFGRPVFIYDAYSRRMLQAVGMKTGRDYETTRRLHEADVTAAGFRTDELATFHGLVVTAGKDARRSGWGSVLGHHGTAGAQEAQQTGERHG